MDPPHSTYPFFQDGVPIASKSPPLKRCSNGYALTYPLMDLHILISRHILPIYIFKQTLAKRIYWGFKISVIHLVTLGTLKKSIYDNLMRCIVYSWNNCYNSPILPVVLSRMMSRFKQERKKERKEKYSLYCFRWKRNKSYFPPNLFKLTWL